jgi:calcineurin-like phosphoesterase family protein
MARWFTADLHLGHANIIRYCDRPFPDVGAMDDALVERWNAAVAPDDEVWVLGDVALGPIGDSLALVGELAGRKLLLSGNHDRCWPGNRKADEWEQRYLDAGFAEVHHGRLHLSIPGVVDPVLACHFPYRGDSQATDRHVTDRPADRGEWLLHGHVHERWRQSDRMINVGVDAWDHRPVPEATIVELIAAGPRDLPPLPPTPSPPPTT